MLPNDTAPIPGQPLVATGIEHLATKHPSAPGIDQPTPDPTVIGLLMEIARDLAALRRRADIRDACEGSPLVLSVKTDCERPL